MIIFKPNSPYQYNLPDKLNPNGFYLIQALMYYTSQNLECYSMNFIIYDRASKFAVDITPLVSPECASPDRTSLRVLGNDKVSLLEDILTGTLRSVEKEQIWSPIAGLSAKELEGERYASLRQRLHSFVNCYADFESEIKDAILKSQSTLLSSSFSQ